MRRSAIARRLSTLSAAVASLVVATALATPAVAGEAAAWTVAAPLPSARSGTFATRLADGTVLLAGGYTTSNGARTYRLGTFAWNPATNVWSSLAPMQAAASSGRTALLSDGRVMTAGGSDADGHVVPQVYDPATNTWSATLAPPTNALSWLVALPDGRALAGAGGQETVVYDPALNGWAEGADLAADHGTGALAARLADGRVLVTGGTAGASEIYDPADGAWDAAATWPRPRTGSSVVLLDDGRVAVLGGDTGPKHLDLYSPASDSWAQGPDSAYAHSASDSAAPLRGTAVFAQSGGHYGEVYDAVANAWRDAGVGSAFRSNVPAIALADGRVLLPGGGTDPVSALVEIYVPAPIAAPVFELPAPGAVTGDVPLRATNDQAATMRFLADGVLLATRPASGGVATGTFSTYGIPNGSYDLTAQACNVAGCGPMSAPVTVTVDNAAPAVTSPAPGDTLEGRVTFAATSPGGGVRFLVDGAGPVFSGAAPYTADVNTFALAEGPHTVTAISCRADGTVCNGPVSAPVTFTVDHTPAVTSPTAGATVSGVADVAVAGRGTTVAVLVDGTPLPAVAPAGGVATVPWSTYGLSNGVHLLTARNCDPATGCLAQSEPVSVTVANTAPTITAPANGAGLAAPTQLTASSGGGTVRFEVDGVPLGSPVAAPYARSFDPGQYAPGTHTIVARQCSASGTLCEGPVSAPVEVTTEGSPTITQPVAGATVAGLVPLRVSTYAPSVRFGVDGSPLGNPVPAADGVATTTWNSFGLANGAHTVTAQGCDASACFEAVRSANVTLENVAPAITAPANGASAGDAVVLTASAPAGSGVTFQVDGITVGHASKAPYSVRWSTVGWALGAHTVTVVGCSADGTRCDGPSGASRTLNLVTLAPRVSLSPSAISPNRDGVRDATTITYDIETTSTAVLRVRNSIGQQVWGKSLGTLTAGRRTQVWNGANSAGIVLPDGLYEVAIETAKSLNGGTVRGVAKTRVVLDRTGPGVFSLSGSGTFYPVVDGYADHFAPSATLSERANVAWRVVNSAGVVVARRATSAAAGGARVSVSWNGRLASGAMAPAGTYRYQWTATDVAGNTRSTGLYPFGLSMKRLVAKSAAVTVNGSSYYSAGGSAECAGASTGLSEYAAGVWLLNVCDPYWGAALAAAFYRVTLPAAVKYGGMRLDVTGFSLDYPTVVRGAVRNVASGTYDLMPGFSTTGDAETTRTLGSFGSGNHMSGRTVDVGVYVPNYYSSQDFDIRSVRVVATYYVLQ